MLLRRRLRVLLAALAAGYAAGCDALLLEPKAPEPAPQPPPSPAPETCASWKPTGLSDTPSAAEIQALFGKLETSPEVEKLMVRLGMSEVWREGDSKVCTYADRGLQLVFRATPAGDKLAAARLYGRAPDAKGYAGALPERLSFAHTQSEVEAAIGKTDSPYCWMADCRYPDQGLTLRSDRRQCLSTVELTAPIAPKQVRYEDLTIKENAVENGVHGVAITFLRTAQHAKGYDTGLTRLCLEDAGGKPRKWPRWARERGEDDTLCLMTRPASFWAETTFESVFVAYALLDQAPGPFTFKGRLTTSLAPPISFGSGPKLPHVELEATGESRLEQPVTMPEIRRARVSVLRAEVEKGTVYDNVNAGRIAAAIATGGASLLIPIPQRWERPDLQWAVYAAGRRAYRSGAFQDVYSASWAGSSAAFPLAPDDQFSVCLQDEDEGGSADTIQCFDFTLDSYAAQVKSGKPLSEGAVRKLVLGPAAVVK